MKSKPLLWIWLILLIAAPIILWILPGDQFDNSSIDLCPSKLIFDAECWGCGITRAVMHAHHFQFEDAIYYNLAVVLVYPFLIWLWFRWVKSTSFRLGVWGKK